MRQPYNSRSLEPIFLKYGRNVAVSLCILTFLFAAIACRKTSVEVIATPPPPPSSADPKTQAEEFYAQRADLMRVRQGLIVLRQAATASPSDYEIAWRLA